MKLSKFFAMMKALEEMYPNPDDIDIIMTSSSDTDFTISIKPANSTDNNSDNLTKTLNNSAIDDENQWHTKVIDFTKTRGMGSGAVGFEKMYPGWHYTGISTKDIDYSSITVSDNCGRTYEWIISSKILYIIHPDIIPTTTFYVKYMRKKEKKDEAK